jgi:TatD DNase family protein
MEPENPPEVVEASAGTGAPSGIVDTHCHLFLLSEEPATVFEEARAAGVGSLICVGIDPESSRRSVELAESFRGIFATAGMHPHEASALDDTAGAVIEELLSNRHVVGVGETGLDQYRKLSPAEDQERALRLHVSLSREHGKPLVVHVRQAWDRILELLDEERAEQVVIHCFSGDVETARECAARGYFLSFAGNLTYPANEQLRSALASAPMDRLLVETDSPFLSPQSRRGRDNSPANAVAVVEEIARLRGEPVENVASAVSANARAAFPGLR